ncbi:unnamed protein product, partial [Meganyctiphanes norvegica]
GQLSISLHERYAPGSSQEITSNVFTTQLSDANEWYKINIRRGEIRDGLFSEPVATYFLDINEKGHLKNTDKKVGNEIRVKTVTSLWTPDCDPRQYDKQPEPTKATQVPPEITKPTHLSTQPPIQPPTQAPGQSSLPSLQPQVNTPSTFTGDAQTIVIAAVTLLLILVAIIVTVILVLRHRRRSRDQALTQPTDHQNRLSRHVSENSLYGSYDNQGIGENQVPQDTSATNSANQRRGSAHESENSLYGAIN